MHITSSLKNAAQDLSGYMLICGVVLAMTFMASTTVCAFNAGSFPDRQTYLSTWKGFLRAPQSPKRVKLQSPGLN